MGLSYCVTKIENCLVWEIVSSIIRYNRDEPYISLQVAFAVIYTI